MIQNKIVARYLDGRIGKGITSDFMPTKEIFHLMPVDAAAGTKPTAVAMKDLKAVFFVKDYAGNSDYHETKEFDPGKPVPGRKIRVVFKDTEILIGTTQGYQPGRPGFFVMPSDPKSNCDRCFVVAAATREVSFL
jgi:hypothetical protein